MSATTPRPQLRVRDYRLLTRIGEGGMGVVHLAQAPDGRRVALKVLRPHVVGDDEARERLAREVTSLRRVRSPWVAEVLDADPWGETPFVATRYVPGLSLHQHLREEGPITGRDLRWFAAGLAEALLAVHAVGVLHRDVKPSNVLLEGRSPVLIDFGLARLVEDPRLTATGLLLGTPGYLAPEILYGEDPTTASDVHSWAATVAFAATGKPPFGGGPALAIMDRVRRGEHDLSAVPADLRPLLEQALAPEPRDRPGLSLLLSHLRAAPPRSPKARPGAVDLPTMPVSLLAGEAAEDAEDRTRSVHPDPGTVVLPGPPGDHPTGEFPTSGRTEVYPQDDHPAPEAPRGGTGRLQRGLTQFGLVALVTGGFALGPYLCLILVAVLALLVRTWSWTTEAARLRQWRRGRRRWWDAPLAAFSAPWYLVVATGGTALLVASAAVLALLAGAVLAVAGLPLQASLLLMGLTLAVSLWWGPGGRRLRAPTRHLLVATSRRGWTGWTMVAVVALGVLGCLYGLAGGSVDWAPAVGAPWRPGTLLGRLVGWL